MAAYVKHYQFVEDLAHGVHNFTSDATCTPTVYLTTNANAPTQANSVLGDITPIAYTNLSSRIATISSSGQTTGTYTLVLNDLTLSASGAVATFRWVGLYNDDPTSPLDPLICHWDYGSDLTLGSGESLTIDFGADAGTTGTLFTLT
jgi:hypothetical protein